MQTTVPGLFAAGETAGVAGAGAALIEGRIAGLAATCRLGRLAEADLARETAALHGKLRPMRRFGVMLNTLFAPPAGLNAITTDDTPICRCEEVTAGEVRAAVAQGIDTVDALKAWTRVGQGPCQGRTCGPILARLIAGWTAGSPAAAGQFHVRPPVKPVPIASLAQESGGRSQKSGARGQESAVSGLQLPASTPAAQAVQHPTSSFQLPASSQRADVVVIGGGIVGAACAYYLSATGLAVRVLERGFPASGTSRACDGLILLSDKSSAAELALAQASAALWGELAGALEMDFEYARRGTLVLAETEAGLAAARATAAAMQIAGVRAEVVDNAGLRALEPALAPDLAGGVLYEDEAQVDARLATVALLMAAQRQGAQLQGNVEVTAIRRGLDGRVAGVVTPMGEIAAGAVVCAAGVWSNQVAGLVGLDLPVRPRKGHILVTSRAPGLIGHPLLEGSYAASVHTAAEGVQVALVAEMTAGGTLLLGSSREFAGFDRSVSLPVMQAIAARAVRFLPDLACASIIRSYAGLRPWSPDHLPLVGPVDAAPGFYLATGHEGAGIGLAPITGRIIADWIVNGQAPALAHPLRPSRFGVQEK
jgi:glycine/D-amino acid oxidase-like deaminating enzyme/bacterioferritin-associated ferredoxin